MSIIAEAAERIVSNIEKVIIGKTHTVRLCLVAMLSNGHVLLEDIPGVAKTTLAKALARSVSSTFGRVQCTPDLLPGDVTGVSVFNQKTVEFEFRPGPAHSQILLADEINRATPRTQAALLECMAEGQITVDGATRVLPSPFMVIATQNPIEQEGTYPLPEAQLDRFMMRLSVGYPTFDSEVQLISRDDSGIDPLSLVEPVLSSAEVLDIQQKVKEVYVDQAVREYIVSIVDATRKSNDLLLGASPRASQTLYRVSQAWAGLNNRNFVTPDDVKMLHAPVLYHRVILHPEARLRGKSTAAIVDELVSSVPAPVDKGVEH